MKKHNILYFCLLILAMSMSSCSLYMDDEALRADLVGFGEHATNSTPYGDIEFQFKDSVYSITDNVLEYIAGVESDTILYYLQSTPSDYMPKVGFCVSAPCSRKIPKGINARVLAIGSDNGFIKVTTTGCSLQEVYEYLDMNIDVPMTFTNVHALDSAVAVSLGVTDDNCEFNDWSQFDKYAPDSVNSSSNTKSNVTRLFDGFKDENGNFWTFYDDDMGDNSSGYGSITLWNIDTKSNEDEKSDKTNTNIANKLLNRLFDEFEVYKKIKDHVSLQWTSQLYLGGTTHVTIGINPDLHFRSTATIEPKLLNDIGLVVDASVDESYIRDLFVKSKKQPKNMPIKLPLINIPVPYVSPALSLVIEPRFSVKAGISGYGKISSSIPWDKYSVDADYYFGLPIIPSFQKLEATDNRSEFTFTGGLNANLTVSGGLGFGIGLAANALTCELTNDLEGSVDASISVSDAAVNSNYSLSAYDPGSNKFEAKIDDVLGFEFKLRKIPFMDKVTDASDFKKFHFEKELSRWNICKWTKYFRPQIRNFDITNKFYFTNTLNKDELQGFESNVSFSSLGFLSPQKPALLVKGKRRGYHSRVYLPTEDVTSLEANRTYHFYVKLDDYMYDPIGFDLAPCYISSDGDTVEVNGYAKEILTNPNSSAVFIDNGIEQAYGTDMAVSDEVVKAWEGYYGLISNKSYSPTAHTGVYYYSWLSSFEIQGISNIYKWGIKVTVFSNVTGATTTHYYTIEQQSLKALTNGTKNIKLWFVSTDNPNDILNGKKGPFTVTVEPWYIADSDPDNKQYPDAKQTLTFKANQMHKDSVFKGKKYTTVDRTAFNESGGTDKESSAKRR